MGVYVGDRRYSLAKALELITSAFSHQLSISHTPYRVIKAGCITATVRLRWKLLRMYKSHDSTNNQFNNLLIEIISKSILEEY